MISRYDQNIEKIFVDESGGTELSAEASDSPDYYVIAGIFFAETDLLRYSEYAEEIVQKHARTGELKSSRLGNNKSRREKVLRDISEAGFPVYCLVVDKNRIWRDSGLRWRPSFYKFLHKMFYSQIKKSFLGIKVVADDYGRSEFMESFKKYVESFSNIFDDFQFASSKDVSLLQIADVIGGTIRRVYMQQDPHEFLKILGYPTLSIEEWPPKSAWDETPEIPTNFDETIVGIALREARKYVEKHLESDQEIDKLKALAVRYLIYRFEQNPEEFIHRSSISEYLREVSGVNISPQDVSNKILADARDSDVILASTNDGVKIPFGAQDLDAWMERTESQVAPYLKRVQTARRMILLASHNLHDIASPERFPELSKYLEATQEP